MRGLAGADFAGDLQRLLRELAEQKNVREPEAGLEVVRFELKNPRELQCRLSEEALGRERLPETQTDAGVIDGSVDGEQGVPGLVTAKFLFQRLTCGG